MAVSEPTVAPPVVSEEKKAESPLKMFAKKLVEVAAVNVASVKEALVAKKLVVVAAVPVAFWKVKLARVDEPVVRMLLVVCLGPNAGFTIPMNQTRFDLRFSKAPS